MLNDVQKKLLEMLKWLTDFITRNNLRYYIVGGTLLGAVRHNGFIPWDDDIDIALPRPDYIKLIELLKDKVDNYKLETPYENNTDYLFTYSKLYDTSTTLVERARKNVRRGLYIDVFPLDGLGVDYDSSLSFFKKIDRKNMFLMTRVCAVRSHRKWYKNFMIIASRCIPFFNEKKYSLKIDENASKYDFEKSIYVANLNGTYRTKEMFNKDVFSTPTLYKFEDIYVFGPQKYEEYLTQLYGDWRKLPPQEKRGIQHDFVTIDLNKSYLDSSDSDTK